MLFTQVKTLNQVVRRNSSFVAQTRLLQKLKEDDTFCQEQLGSSLILIYSKGKPLLSKGSDGFSVPTWVEAKKLKNIRNPVQNAVVLGLSKDNVPYFAVNYEEPSEIEALESEYKSRLTDLRVGLFLVDNPTAHTLSKGWSLLQWKKNSNFCSRCGNPLVKNLSGSQASCSSCTSVFYPSTSPVGIVSICDPATDRLLLIRQPRYPPGMYSCIAGFLDVGETLENCVRREAAEEVGIEVDKVSYLGSQHWPFPAGSLMIGCQAEASPGQVPDPCKVELEDARWFTRKEVQEAFDRIKNNPGLRVKKDNDPDKIFVAPRGAIANFLVGTWLHNNAK